MLSAVWSVENAPESVRFPDIPNLSLPGRFSTARCTILILIRINRLIYGPVSPASAAMKFVPQTFDMWNLFSSSGNLLALKTGKAPAPMEASWNPSPVS